MAYGLNAALIVGSVGKVQLSQGVQDCSVSSASKTLAGKILGQDFVE